MDEQIFSRLNDFSIDDKRIKRAFDGQRLYTEIGKINKVVGNLIVGHIPQQSTGSLVTLQDHSGKKTLCEVVGFEGKNVMLMPLETIDNISKDSELRLISHEPTASMSSKMLGRVLNGIGEPIDQKGSIVSEERRPIYKSPPGPLERNPIKDTLQLGIKAVDGLLAVGKGQRLGIMAASGVGKSVLLGMMARNTKADINVIALIGERGREVVEFIENDLGPEGLSRSVLVVATSNETPMMRMRAAYVATTIAEFFCETGKNVLLLMDSATRFAMAGREIGLAIGEPPTRKGYPPSVFTKLPVLMERAGNFKGKGSITAFYTVLVEGNDIDEPITDACRSILDGHIFLDRDLAQKNHYPAIDVLGSLSRLMSKISTNEHIENAGKIRNLLADYKANEDLISIGAYVRGTQEKIDRAIDKHPIIMSFLQQLVDEKISLEQTIQIMAQIANKN